MQITDLNLIFLLTLQKDVERGVNSDKEYDENALE